MKKLFIIITFLTLFTSLPAQTRGVFTSNATSTTKWDSLSFGMLSRQIIVQLDSDNLSDTLWISFSSRAPTPSNTIMLLSKFQGEGLMLNLQSKFIKTKASAAVKRRIIVQ